MLQEQKFPSFESHFARKDTKRKIFWNTPLQKKTFSLSFSRSVSRAAKTARGWRSGNPKNAKHVARYNYNERVLSFLSFSFLAFRYSKRGQWVITGNGAWPGLRAHFTLSFGLRNSGHIFANCYVWCLPCFSWSDGRNFHFKEKFSRKLRRLYTRK